MHIKILEGGMGLNADPVLLSFETGKLHPPELKIVKGIEIDDDDEGASQENSNGKIEPGEQVEITAVIQNAGTGDAQGAMVEIIPPAQGVYPSDSRNFDLGTIHAGTWKKITFSLVITKLFENTEIPLDIRVKERRERFSFNDKLILPLNKKGKKIQEFIITGHEDKNPKRPPDPLPGLVDVDTNIPTTSMRNPDAIAIVMGNRNCLHEGVDPVPFALRDAAVIKDYLIQALGYREDRVKLIENGIKSDFELLFGNEKEHRGQLYKQIKADVSDVFIYYSGHGAPNPETGQGYFVPADCHPDALKLTGYPLAVFARNLQKLPARHITVIIDACFSQLQMEGLKDVYISIENPLRNIPRATIITSSTGKQVSCSYPDKKHGLFTYFFLKGLGGAADTDKDGSITLLEMQTFVADSANGVPHHAYRLKNREQTPVVTGDKERVLVKLK